MNLHNGRPTVFERGDPDFNTGHGDKFIVAFDRAFNLKPIIAIEQGGQSTKSPWQSVPARLQSLSAEQLGEATSASMKEGLLRNSKLGTRGMGTAASSQLRSSRSVLVEVKHDTTNKNISTEYNINAARSGDTVQVVLGKLGESRINFPSAIQPYSVARSITAGFDPADRGSNPLRAIPARLSLSGNLLSLQDIGGQISMARYHPSPLPAEQKHAGVFSRYVTNFQSRVFPPACSLLFNKFWRAICSVRQTSISQHYYNHLRIPSERSDMRMQRDWDCIKWNGQHIARRVA